MRWLAMSAAAVLAASMPQVAIATERGCDAVPPEFAELLSARWLTAMKQRSGNELVALYALDAVVISPVAHGPKQTPAEVARFLRKLARNFKVFGHSDKTIRAGCNTVLEFGSVEMRGMKAGKPVAFDLQYSRIFEKRAGYWLVTLDHMTASPSEARTAKSTVRRPNHRRVSDVERSRLHELVRVSRGSTRAPQVAGMLIRPPRLATKPAGVGTERDGTRNTPPATATPVKASSRRSVRRSARKKSSLSWARSIPGFEGME